MDDVGDGAQERDLLGGRAAGGGVVVDAVVGVRAELLYDGACGAIAHIGLDVVDPLVVGPRAIRKGITVHREVGAGEAGVVAQRPQVGSPAAAVGLGALDEHPVPGKAGRTHAGYPFGGEVQPLGGGESDGLVYRVEIDQGVVQVPGGEGVPHLVPGGQVAVDDLVATVFHPVAQDDLEAPGRRGVDDAVVGVPGCGGGVDRQPDGVGAQVALERGEHGVGLAPGGVVVVVRRQPLQDEPVKGEVVAKAGPVHAVELTGVEAGVRGGR